MKKINITLDSKSIDNAINELKNYNKELKTKTQIFTDRLADVGISVAYQLADVPGTYGTHQMGSRVTFSKVSVGGGQTLLMGIGQEFMSSYVDSEGEQHIEVVKPLYMLEFGSGAFAIDPSEASARFGVVGGQGTMATQGHEKDTNWGINGGWTAITPTMPMYNAYKTMFTQVTKIAREVWS